MKVRDVGKSASRFENRAAGATQEYVEGIEGATDWEANTLQATKAYNDGLQKSLAEKSWERGVKGSQSHYAAQAKRLGPQRFAQGVQGAGSSWAAGFQPYADALSRTQLKPRGSKGSAENLQRMVDNAKLMIETKKNLRGR